jgi:uncharacterized membrane protein
MMNIFFTFLLSAIVFTVLDLFWLVKVAPQLYRRHIGHLMAEKVNRIGALLFYVLYHVGLVVFVLLPAQGNLFEGWLLGSLFGLVTYATYDLTNLATLKAWPVKITIIDLMWGTFLTGVSTVITLWLMGVFGL